MAETQPRKPSKVRLKENYVQDLFAWSQRLLSILPSSKCRLNFAYRQALGFVMTQMIESPSDLHRRDLIFVEKWNSETGEVVLASADSMPEISWLHRAVFQNRSSVIFSFWIEGKDLESQLSKQKILTAKLDQSSGSGLFTGVEKYLGQGNLIGVGELGVLSMGCTTDDAGEALVQLLDA